MDDFFSASEFKIRHNSITKNPYFPVFKKSILQLTEFFWDLDDLISFRNAYPFWDDKKTHLLQAQPIKSVIYTLNSIKLCCEYGSISDANTLIRKYRDDLFFYLYLLEACNKKEQLQFPNSKHTNNIKKWFNNKLTSFNFNSDVIPYLKSNATINEVINKYKLNDTWRVIFKNLNNYVHNNGVLYCTTNFCSLKDGDFKKLLYDVDFKIKYIAINFVVFFILINPHFIMSSDYIDYCDMGMKPPDDSQYWIAPFIQEFVDENIAKYNPKLKQFLKDNIYMNIE